MMVVIETVLCFIHLSVCCLSHKIGALFKGEMFPYLGIDAVSAKSSFFKINVYKVKSGMNVSVVS